MILFAKFILIVIFLAIQKTTAIRIVCYTTNWSQYRSEGGKFFPENIDPFLCTHIIYSFAKLNNFELSPNEWNDESTEWMKGLYERTTDLKKKNPNLKILIAVGGWNMGSTDFSNMVTNEAARKKFVSSSIEFIKRNKFDGLDLDWEYPANREGSRPSDKRLFTILIEELKSAFTPHDLILSAAVSAGKRIIDSAYEISNIARSLDFLNIMTYDYHGSWEKFTGHNSPLFSSPDEPEDEKFLNVDFTINYYINNGTPRDKINLGLATYGRSFKLLNSNLNGFGSPISGPGDSGPFTKEPGFLSYYEICKNPSLGWNRQWNDQQKVPCMFKNDQWIGYDDEQSLSLKVDYLKSKNLGGAMFWALDLDDFSGSFCNKGPFPFINFVKNSLINNNPTTPTTATSSSLQPTTINPTTITPINNKCPNGNGYYPDIASGCTKYYVCIHFGTKDFQTIEFTCPGNLLFDSTINICNHAVNVVC